MQARQDLREYSANNARTYVLFILGNPSFGSLDILGGVLCLQDSKGRGEHGYAQGRQPEASLQAHTLSLQ